MSLFCEPLSATAVAPGATRSHRRVSIVRGLQESTAALHAVGFIAFVSSVTLGFAGVAVSRALWHDELVTYYVSKQPDVRSIWAALAAGVDLNPPLLHLATRAALFTGDGPLAMRLPSLVAFTLALPGIFLIAVRYSSPCVAWLSAALFVWTQAGTYAYEARPYAMLLAFGAWAYVAWQRALKRPLWAATLAVSLAGAVSTHYYAVLLFPPLAAAEIVRTWERRSLNIPVWLAFMAGATPLLAWVSLMQAAQKFSAHYWGRPSIGEMLSTFDVLLGGASVPALALVGVIAVGVPLYGIFRSDGATPAIDDERWAPLSDCVAALLLAGVPLTAYLLGLVTGAFTPRYALSGVIGWCILLPRVVERLARDRASRFALTAGVVVVVVLTEGKQLHDMRAITATLPSVPALAMFKNIQASPGPILITEAVLYLQLYHYAPPPLRERLVYGRVPDRALAIVSSNTASEGLARLQAFEPTLRTRPFDEIIAQREPILVYGLPGWTVSLLRASGASLQVVGNYQNRVLLQATW